MPVRDSFDPCWQMPKPDDSVAGAYVEVPGKASDSKRPSVIQYKGDGTAQLRSAAATKHNAEIPRGGSEGSKTPAGVGKFNPLGGFTHGTEGLTHGAFEKDDAAESE